MESLRAFQFSIESLAVFFILPFAYLILQAKLSHDESLRKRANFVLLTVCTILAAMVVMKVFVYDRQASFSYRLLALLHLALPILTLLLLSEAKKSAEDLFPQLLGDSAKEKEFLPVNKDVEKLTWEDIIVDSGLKQELQLVIQLIKTPKLAKQYGIEIPKGILFYGPPGTGKTTLAKVMASEAGFSFFTFKLDQVISKWVGSSEKNLTRLFESARKARPAIVFIDEVDSIGRARAAMDGSWSDNLLNHLLQLIDGVVKTEGVYIVAATNRVDLLDPAFKRAGRFNKVIEIPLPGKDARTELLAMGLGRLKLSAQVNVSELSEMTEGYSAADIKEICNQAALNAFKRENLTNGTGAASFVGLKEKGAVNLDDIYTAISDQDPRKRQKRAANF